MCYFINKNKDKSEIKRVAENDIKICKLIGLNEQNKIISIYYTNVWQLNKLNEQKLGKHYNIEHFIEEKISEEYYNLYKERYDSVIYDGLHSYHLDLINIKNNKFTVNYIFDENNVLVRTLIDMSYKINNNGYLTTITNSRINISYQLMISEGIIPKGSEYYYNYQTMEYVSNKLILQKIIFNENLLKSNKKRKLRQIEVENKLKDEMIKATSITLI